MYTKGASPVFRKDRRCVSLSAAPAALGVSALVVEVGRREILKFVASSCAAVGFFFVAISGANAQSVPSNIGVIGNSVEMYLGGSCPGETCSLSFPFNNTGRVIKITYVSCKFTVTGANSVSLLDASIGPSSTAGGPFLKETSFNSLEFYSGNRFVMSATPDIFLGASRFLTVNGDVSDGILGMKCQAAGVFAQ